MDLACEIDNWIFKTFYKQKSHEEIHTLQIRAGVVFIRKKHKPTKRKTWKKAKTNTLFKKICEKWQTLTEFDKQTWEEYHINTLECANSWFQYVKNNMQLNHPEIPGTSILLNIAPAPAHPDTPQGLSLDYQWPADTLELTWTDTYGGAVWIQSWLYKRVGWRRFTGYRWKYNNWYPSSYEIGNIYGRDLGSGRTTAVTIRALNPRGEVSDFADPEEKDTPERPVVKISADPRSGPSPLTVQFTSLSTGLISWYLWDFGDDNTSELQNPSHEYQDPGVYHVRLTLGGPAETSTTRIHVSYIHATTEPAPDPHVYVSDSFNNRIFKRLRSDLSFVAKIGTFGTGIDQFKNPIGIAADDTYLYIAESDGHRIQKRVKSNLGYVDRIGSSGSGNDQFSNPQGMCVDETYIYVADAGNNRIVKRLKSNLSYAGKIGSLGSGNNQFDSPAAICCNDTHIFVVDVYNHRIHQRLKSDLSLVRLVGTEGQGNDQFYYPLGIGCDDLYVFVGDGLNHRVHVRLSANLAYVRIFGSSGDGNNEFNRPMGIAPDGDNIIIADRFNNRIKTHRISDGAYVRKIGSLGDGNNQFNQPTDCATQNPFSL